jgi:hypothetical protein
MAQATNLLLKNAAAANVTYNPTKIVTGDQAIYTDRTNGTLAGQSKASLTLKESATTRKVSGKVTYPVLNATTGALSHTLIGTFDVVCPLVATLAERQEVRARVASLIADAIVTAAVDNGETPW